MLRILAYHRIAELRDTPAVDSRTVSATLYGGWWRLISSGSSSAASSALGVTSNEIARACESISNARSGTSRCFDIAADRVDVSPEHRLAHDDR